MPIRYQSGCILVTPQQFEHRVGVLYECLGFAVRRDTDVSGKQVDLLIERIVAGVGRIRVAVECKFRKEEKPAVGNQEVFDFISFANKARADQAITYGVMVTNATFSRNAQRAADTAGVVLKTISEIENELFSLQDTYRQFIEDYRQKDIFASYVESAGTCVDGVGRRTVKDVESHILKALDRDWCQMFWILGDFGSGKTTLLERLKYRLAKKYLQERKHLKPLLFQLRDYHRFSDLQSYIEHTVNKELHREIPKALFWSAVKNREFLLLLDAFDEMLPNADRTQRAKQLATLSPLLCAGSRAVISCRPSYFVSSDEYEELLRVVQGDEAPIVPTKKHASFVSDAIRRDAYLRIKQAVRQKFVDRLEIRRLSNTRAATLELALFTEEQIKTYLKKWEQSFRTATNNKHGWEDVLSFLNKIYDLQDLMSRPILLHMIAETVVQQRLDLTDEKAIVGPTSLYEIYTDTHFDRDWNKGEVRRKSLSKEQRRDFSEALALTVLIKPHATVSWKEISAAVSKRQNAFARLSGVIEEHGVEVVLNDIQITTFITRDHNEFRFVHKSFMEYFVARYLRARLVDARKEPLFETNLPKEVLYFLGGYAYAETDVRDRLWKLESPSASSHRSSAQLFRRNICGAIAYSGPEHKRWIANNVLLLDLDLQRINFFRCNWKDSKIERTRIRNVCFEACECTQLVVRECEASGVTFKRGSYDLILDKCRWDGIKVSNADFKVVADRSNFPDLSISECKLELHGDLLCEKASIDRSQAILSGGRFRNLKAHGGSLRLVDQTEVTDAEISNTQLFVGVDVSVTDSLIKNATVQFEYEDSNPIRLGGCSVKRSTVRCIPKKGASQGRTLFDGATFEGVIVIGLPVLAGQLRDLRQDSFQVFKTSRGILVVFDPAIRDFEAANPRVEYVLSDRIALLFCPAQNKSIGRIDDAVLRIARSMGMSVPDVRESTSESRSR
jgi:Holliday junction resolvase/uncharacterized protein YjbI with pentapeptide repeats